MISISEAAEFLGVCVRTLQRWDNKGYLVAFRTEGNHRRYDRDALAEYVETGIYEPQPRKKTGKAAIYCRVSTHRQKDDLERQREYLAENASGGGYDVLEYKDIGSGLNGKRRNFLRLIGDALDGKFDKVYLTYLDRLARFGTEPLKKIFKHSEVDLEVLQVPEDVSLEQLLVNDLVGLITSFSGKLYRMRRGKNKKKKAPKKDKKT